MRTRHKPPTLVSMWMLDVFCCALGCMILLFVLTAIQAQYAAMQARLRAAAAAKTLDELKSVQSQLVATRDDLNRTKKVFTAEVDDLTAKLAATTADLTDKEKELARTAADLTDKTKQLARATTDLTDTKKTLASSAAANASLEDEMRKKEKKATELTADLAKLRAAELDLQKLLRRQDMVVQELESARRKSDDRLTDLDAKYRALQKESMDTAAALSAAGKVEDDLTAARGTIKDLRKQLDDVNANIIDLQGEKKKLADKFDKLRIDSDSRFAGIAMTGRNVVFLIDISGSMKLIDEKTPDANKWPGVIETVGRVMRSIPDLERFQVVLFSRTAKYLHGSGEWQQYRGEASVKAVTDGLKDTVPAGDTNLYAGFDLTFKLKEQGLDTVYLFSDGLPTSGQGLTPEQDRTVTDAQRTDLLVKHLRGALKNTWNRPGDGRRVKINAVGFFYESPEVGAFLWALARENDGSFVGMSKP